ncbi:MAG: hypothetical protein ACK4WD_09935 [Flavobacteriales bacterium]|jgi:hypothetical protein
MKSIALTLTILFSVLINTTVSADNTDVNRDKNKKKTALKRSMDKEVSKHIFYPQSTKEEIEGTADVMLQVYPEGDVRVVLIQTKNPLIKKFIESQVRKMKVDKDSVVIGEVFRYRLTFKKSA